MAGIELVADKKKGTAYPPGRRMGLKVCDATLERGVWLRPLGDVIVLMPPLAISEKELHLLIKAVIEAIHEVAPSEKRN
jgi:adenosylmethionine-8-amino-7-oxononanoate aminotransferase